VFRYLYKIIGFWTSGNQADTYANDMENVKPDHMLSKVLQDNIKTLTDILGTSSDIVERKITFGREGQSEAVLLYLNGLTDTSAVNEYIIKPLMHESRIVSTKKNESALNNQDFIKDTLLTVSNLEKSNNLDEIIDNFLSGSTILLLDGSSEALIINLKKWEKRGVNEPQTGSVVRGPREAFSEALLVNTALLRRKIKNSNLILEKMVVGKQTKTDICIAYLKNIANEKLIEELKSRLKRIKTDSILESGYIEQYIEDAPYSIYATIAASERPDVISAKILEGRAAILVDGTPFVLTVPALFIEGFQSSEDYYIRPFFASLLRMLRFMCYVITIFLPSIYVALSSYHQELIPTPLLFTMAASHEGVPLPSMMEAGLMVFIFEILREAGVRLPRPIGQAVSIVGALVLGEAAVSAGFVGAPMIIVVALTAVSGFVIPSQTEPISILRCTFLILSAILGAFGIVLGFLGLLVHLSTLRSFGTPFLSPFAPLIISDLKDSYVRLPLWAMLDRPRSIVRDNLHRTKAGLKPAHPKKR
jgi:spore germination protein KA